MPAWEINSPVFISSVCLTADAELEMAHGRREWRSYITLRHPCDSNMALSPLCDRASVYACLSCCSKTIWPFMGYDVEYNSEAEEFWQRRFLRDLILRVDVDVKTQDMAVCRFLICSVQGCVCACVRLSTIFWWGLLLLNEALWKCCFCSAWTFLLLTLSTATSSRRAFHWSVGENIFTG